MPVDRAGLLSTKGFHGRGAERYAGRWIAALRAAEQLDEADLPTRNPRTDGPPLPRSWVERDPVAARRLAWARTEITKLAEQHHLPVENLLTPDHLRRVLWSPPQSREPAELRRDVETALAGLGARPWQVGLTAELVTDAILAADVPPEEPETEEPETADAVESLDSSDSPDAVED
jgi:ribonuclease D